MLTGGTEPIFSSSPPRRAATRITDFASGTDKIDLRAFVGIDANDVTETMSGANTIVAVDINNDSIADFSFILFNAAAPADGDYFFA